MHHHIEFQRPRRDHPLFRQGTSLSHRQGMALSSRSPNKHRTHSLLPQVGRVGLDRPRIQLPFRCEWSQRGGNRAAQFIKIHVLDAPYARRTRPDEQDQDNGNQGKPRKHREYQVQRNLPVSHDPKRAIREASTTDAHQIHQSISRRP